MARRRGPAPNKKRPKGAGRGRPKQRKPAPKAVKPKKKKRRFKLSLKSKVISKESGDYKDTVGWTSGSVDTNFGTNLTADPTPKPKESQFIKHQCTLCGAIMQVPKPKREKYTIFCPHCEHVDNFG